MHGFHKKLLYLDVTQRRYQVEELPENFLRRYLGGRGLGSYLLWRELHAGTDPFSPDNVLILATGPLSGTNFPGASRYELFSRSPLTNAFAESSAGGRVATQLSRTGYDAIVIRGASPSPIYLEISDEGVGFQDASPFWGMDTYYAEEAILAQVAAPHAQALVIGPAGENLVRFACVVNNKWRSAGRTGLGAVLGAKKIKAIVFHGRKERPLADPTGFKDYLRAFRAKGLQSPSAANYSRYGTPSMVAVTNTAGAFPAYYWTAGTLPGWEKISADALLENLEVRPHACPGCFLACGKLSTVKEGRHKGLTIEGPEYETIYAFGGLCAITSLEELVYLNDLCDRYGLDTMTAGNLAGLVMEATRRGRLNFPLQYGDAEGVATLLRQIVNREGAGAILADGIVAASRAWNLEDLAIHVKGLEPAAYDPRVLKGMALAYATSPRGACHLRATFYKYELSGQIDADQVEGKAAMFVEIEDRMTMMDTLILCRFFRDLVPWEELQNIIRLTTGLDFDLPALRHIANEITTLARCFNVREGFGYADDLLPARFHDEPIDGHLITRAEFAMMLSDYYRLRGWDERGSPIACGVEK
ncbi:MAG: aldehyde ferredoxin oxidoreductase family protein [Chloroflexi bacterium]|nr:aldehyde ferredoxin oxidoreductase family protein [Chloroflexota bacterium]